MKHFSELEDDLEGICFDKYKAHDNGMKSMVEYLNVPCAFDIETTSTFVNGDKFAFMYTWCLGIMDGNFIYYGRKWEEFIKVIEILQRCFGLTETCRIICYVHNLGFEFQFMRKYFKWHSVFAIDERKPIKALLPQGIEFRDSYILSGYSLEKLAANLLSHNVKKLVGNLDYKLIHHCETPLNDEELAYINNDVEILLYYIDEQITQYENIAKVPLTNTGRVRDYVRNNCLHYGKSHKNESLKSGKTRRYRELMQELVLDLGQYSMMKRCFQGGFAHASVLYSGQLLENVHSVDFISSYPYVMLSELYPMSRPLPVDILDIAYLQEIAAMDYGWCADVRFTMLQSKTPFETYLSKSKCRNIVNGEINNGRVFQAQSLETSITNVDFEIIITCYDFESIEVIAAYKFYMQYMPKQIIESILHLYQLKTMLKGVEGKEAEYLLSKEMLNSVYGMCVTDIIRDKITYDDDWFFKSKHELDIETIMSIMEKNNRSWKRFLYYPWGVYVTAYARRNLWTGIFAMGDDYIYSDTDSLKYLNHAAHSKFITAYNRDCKRKLKAMSDFRKVDIKLTEPCNAIGEKKLLGAFNYEGCYELFKTLGAKRYMVCKDGKVQLTVAGLSKQNGVSYMMQKCGGNIRKVFKMFDDELTIPANATGKSTHTYIDFAQEYDIADYLGNKARVSALSSIHLDDCEFSLSISKQYAEFIKAFRQGYVAKRGFI